jgi:hypothetical protein
MEHFSSQRQGRVRKRLETHPTCLTQLGCSVPLPSTATIPQQQTRGASAGFESALGSGIRTCMVAQGYSSLRLRSPRISCQGIAMKRDAEDLAVMLKQLQSQIADRNTELGQVKSDLEQARNEVKRLTRIIADAKSSSLSRVQTLERGVQVLEADAWNLRGQLERSDWKLQSVIARRWWRLGTVLGRMRSNPFQFFLLPGEVARILSRPSNLPEMPRRREAPPLRPETRPALSTAGSPEPDIAGTETTPSFDAPSAERPRAEPSRDLLVATLLGEMSYSLFEYEFRALQVTSRGWKQVLESRPTMLLVESPWNGTEDAWLGFLGGDAEQSEEFTRMLEAFTAAGVPTVYWINRDLPVGHPAVDSAKLFDVVFTVSEESIPSYVEAFGHEKVFLLPPFIQPRIHNPNSVGGRKSGVAVVSDYPAREHPEQAAQADAVLDPARGFPLSIFSSSSSGASSEWPARYEPFIVGSLPYTELLTAYKMFDVFLNPDCAPGSQSVPDRRLFELAASGTPILSCTSPAIDKYFRDVVVQVDDSNAGRFALRTLLRSEEMRSRMAVRGIRTCMREHTASLRFDDILELSGVMAPRSPPTHPVTVVAPTNHPEHIGEILMSAARQSYPNLQLVIAAHGIDLDEPEVRRQAADLGIDSTVIVGIGADEPLGEVVNAGFRAADGEFIGKIDDDDFYGPEFVADLIDAFQYTEAGIVGKQSYYAYIENLDATVIRFPGAEHMYVPWVAGATMIVKRSVFDAVQFQYQQAGSDSQFMRDAAALGVRIYSANRYNFMYMRSASEGHHTFKITDLELASKGRIVQYGLNLTHVSV